jgi:hypothetical protein
MKRSGTEIAGNIKCLGSDISCFCLEFEKVIDITMPDIEGYRDSTETSTELIHCYGCIIDNLNPWIDTTCCSLDPTDLSSTRTDMSKINSHSSSVLGDLCDIFDSMIDRPKIICDIELETTRELVPVRTRIDECWSCKRDLLFTTVFIDLGRQI